MPVDNEMHEAIRVAVQDEITRRKLVHHDHHDGHAGSVASKIRTLELLIASKSGGSGGVNTHEVVHSILDERLAQLPAITQQLPPDVPTRSEVRQLVTAAVQALPRPTPQKTGVAGDPGLTMQDINMVVGAAIAQASAQIEQKFEGLMQQMFSTMVLVETITAVEELGHDEKRPLIEAKAAEAGLGYEAFIDATMAEWDAMKLSALGGVH